MRSANFTAVGFLFSALLPPLSYADLWMKAELRDLKSDAVIYNQELSKTFVGSEETMVSEFKNLNGELVAREQMKRDGVNLRSYFIEWPHEKIKGEIEVRGEKIHFKLTKDGKITEDTEDLEAPFLIGPLVSDFIVKNWDELMKEETLHVRFGVTQRKETVGFKLFKVDSEKHDKPGTVRLKMKPTSFVIAAIVDPIYFVVGPDKKMIEMFGRTIPKRKSGDSWKDLDVHSVFTHFK